MIDLCRACVRISREWKNSHERGDCSTNGDLPCFSCFSCLGELISRRRRCFFFCGDSASYHRMFGFPFSCFKGEKALATAKTGTAGARKTCSKIPTLLCGEELQSCCFCRAACMLPHKSFLDGSNTSHADSENVTFVTTSGESKLTLYWYPIIVRLLFPCFGTRPLR